MFLANFYFFFLQKHEQRSRWWNIEMKNDEQFGDISLHFSARHPQKEIFHAAGALPGICNHLTGPFWSKPSFGPSFASHFIDGIGMISRSQGFFARNMQLVAIIWQVHSDQFHHIFASNFNGSNGNRGIARNMQLIIWQLPILIKTIFWPHFCNSFQWCGRYDRN